MQRKKIATISRLNGYGPEKGRRRTPVFEVNGYAPEKSRLNSQFVHLFILFIGERTSNHGIFMPCWGLEDLSESERVWGGLRTDREYHDAIVAFDRGDFTTFLDRFIKAIHSRYDLEKPVALRYIRRKLEIINRQRVEIEALKAEKSEREKTLKRLAAEYTLLGKECEQECMTDAAIRNYEKALELYPDAHDARRRLKKLRK